MREIRIPIVPQTPTSPLKMLRKVLKRTQGQLARDAKTDITTIQRHERNRHTTGKEIPKRGILPLLSALAIKFGWEVDLVIRTKSKPIVILVTNPISSCGSSTVCLSLAGYLAHTNKNVRMLIGPGQGGVSWMLRGRSRSSLPRLDYLEFSDTFTLRAAVADSTAYDVVLLDLPRFINGNHELNCCIMNEAVRIADLAMMPLENGYPDLRGPDNEGFRGSLLTIRNWRAELKTLLLMNRVYVPDECEDLSPQGCANENNDFKRRVLELIEGFEDKNIVLAETALGSRNAYGTIGYSINNTRESTGKTPFDMDHSRSVERARNEIKSLWVEIEAYAASRSKLRELAKT